LGIRQARSFGFGARLLGVAEQSCIVHRDRGPRVRVNGTTMADEKSSARIIARCCSSRAPPASIASVITGMKSGFPVRSTCTVALDSSRRA